MKVKKEIFIHFSFLISFFILITIYRRWFDTYYIPFWLGGVLGTIMPYLDQLIYVYVLRPDDSSSQQIAEKLSERNVWGAIKTLLEVRYLTDNLIFHTVYFQLIFLMLTFFIVSSSGSVFGRGIVLAFSLHLFIDQITDLMETGGVANWFKKLPVNLDKEQRRWYLVFIFLILLVLGLLA